MEAALDVLDQFPDVDSGVVRGQVEVALQMLLKRIWPYLDELDGTE